MEPGEVEEMKRTSPMHLFYHVGPQYPETWWNGGILPQVQALSTQDEQVMSFLNDMNKSYGPNSVLYISFGTTFLPYNTPHLFDALVKTILAADPPLPFLFAGGTTNKLLTAEHRDEIRKSGRGLLAGFVPQQAVLKHEATGWYLSHAGSNSINEAFLNQVLWFCGPIHLTSLSPRTNFRSDSGLHMNLSRFEMAKALDEPHIVVQWSKEQGKL
ncbi:hypothetical protein BT96DRAFT_1099902 [Gymnopus androsaceus JB14]|uniref:UDP-Glycosyltransferase/glycogen phosphorylase n=1 Tax=Gymnopus androsaceus JB14 TaxID=1447944 RepID=A0A6A4IHH8_9AGAR|nr:hypothetical protein BT96DRAFT_1099902 [Gymnopus androsaceus JB14]